jgi:hypothetical protein
MQEQQQRLLKQQLQVTQSKYIITHF